MKKIASYHFLLLLIFVVSACGNKKSETIENKADNKPTKKGAVNSTEAGKAETCNTTQISLTGEGGFKMDKFEVKGIQVYHDMMQSDKVKYPALILTLSNYPKEGEYVGEPSKAGEVRLILNFSGKSNSTIEAKSYFIGADGFGKSDALVASYSTQDKMHALNLPVGKAEITYLSEEKVCGTIDVKSKNEKTTIKGIFSCSLK